LLEHQKNARQRARIGDAGPVRKGLERVSGERRGRATLLVAAEGGETVESLRLRGACGKANVFGVEQLRGFRLERGRMNSAGTGWRARTLFLNGGDTVPDAAERAHVAVMLAETAAARGQVSRGVASKQRRNQRGAEKQQERQGDGAPYKSA
jgi:hypothetical protein